MVQLLKVLMTRNLNEIVTNWDELFSAHARSGIGETRLLAGIFQRYFGAIRNYLASIVKDEHVADDLAQEFAVRFLRGDFQKLHPNKGRFRDFLKVVLRNMVIDHFRRLKNSPAELEGDILSDPQDSVADQFDQLFLEHWREDLLRRTWQSFQVVSRRRGALYYEALCEFANSGGMSSEELSQRLSVGRGEPVSSVAARQTLHRARQMFADCLREEVRLSLPADENHPEAVEEELCALQLTKYLGSYPANRVPK